MVLCTEKEGESAQKHREAAYQADFWCNQRTLRSSGVFCEYYMRVGEEKGSPGGILVLCFVSPGAACRCISCEWCSNTPVNREGLWKETEANGRGVVGNISFSGYIRRSSNLPHLSGVPRQD